MKKFKSKVIVYHDETFSVGPQNYRGHALLFIPIEVNIDISEGFFEDHLKIQPQETLLKNILDIRDAFNADHKFHFTMISGKKWYEKDEADKSLVSTGVDALKIKNTSLFQSPLFCKLAIILYPKCDRASIKLYAGDEKKEKILRYDETLLRMLLKGAVHYLYDENHCVEIYKIITDGEPNYRKLDKQRILGRLFEDALVQLRAHVTFSPDVEIVSLLSDHKIHTKGTNKYKHANFLQLADMLLGASIQSCYKNNTQNKSNVRIGDTVENKKGIISAPIRDMLDKTQRGKNFRHSSHFKAFAISQAIPADNGWDFRQIKTEVIIDENTHQLQFPF